MIWDMIIGVVVVIPLQTQLVLLILINVMDANKTQMIIAIPKNVALTANGDSKYVLEFGESTSYEMAIARRFNKPILFG